MSVRSIFLKALIPVFVPFLLLLLSVASVQKLLTEEEAEIRYRLADKTLMSHTNKISKLFNHCGVSLTVHSITHNAGYEVQFEKYAETIPVELESFKQLPVFSPHQKKLKDQVEQYAEEGSKTIKIALESVKNKSVADDVKQARVKELYASINAHSKNLHETAQAIGKGVISEDREKGHSHRRIKYVGSILLAYLVALVILAAFSRHMAKAIELKKGVSITRKIFFQGVMPVFLPLFIMSGLVVFLTDKVHRSENEIRSLVRDIAIIEHANAVSDLSSEIRACSLGYSVTKNAHLSDRFDASVAKIPDEINELRELFKSQTDQLAMIDRIEETTQTQIKKLTGLRDLLNDNAVDVAQIRDNHAFGSSHYQENLTQDKLRELTEPARRIEEDSEEKQKASTLLFITIGAVVGSFLSALGLCFAYAKKLAGYFSSNF